MQWLVVSTYRYHALFSTMPTYFLLLSPVSCGEQVWRRALMNALLRTPCLPGEALLVTGRALCFSWERKEAFLPFPILGNRSPQWACDMCVSLGNLHSRRVGVLCDSRLACCVRALYLCGWGLILLALGAVCVKVGWHHKFSAGQVCASPLM